MQSFSLYLFPADPRSEPPDRTTVHEVLNERRLTGKPLDDRRYTAGEGLLDEIGFTGCAVAVKFEPATEDDRDYCHLVLLGPYPSPRAFTGANTVKPRCPECGERLSDWQALIRAWQENGSELDWTCPSCGTTTRTASLRWRRHAAFGRLLVEIRQVFPSEALPHDTLLAALRSATGCAWDYAWAGSSE